MLRAKNRRRGIILSRAQRGIARPATTPSSANIAPSAEFSKGSPSPEYGGS